MAFKITKKCRGCRACVRPCPTQAISGERKQVHIIDPVRCIECGTCGRVCPYDAVQTPQGEVARRIMKMNWNHPVINQKTCVSCGLCITICPVSCLSHEYIQEKTVFRGYPLLSKPGACISCNFCADICPVEAIKMLPKVTRSG